MNAGKNARANLLELLSLEVVGGNEHVFAVKKADVDAFTVAAGGAGGATVQAVYPLEGTFQHRAAPEFFPVGSV